MYGIFAVTCPTLITQSQILTAFHTHLEKNKRVYRWFVQGFSFPPPSLRLQPSQMQKTFTFQMVSAVILPHSLMLMII